MGKMDIHDDPLRPVLLCAVRELRSARTALAHLTKLDQMPEDMVLTAVTLGERLRADDIFAMDEAEEEEMLVFAERLGDLARTHTEIRGSGGHGEYDEYYETEVFSDTGFAMIQARSALNNVVEALSEVRCHLDAERIAEKLRT
ncbi:hypothetical protein R5H30_01175 [Sulfitobacter sp. D35]|uniref:hypothetical protein n=1 Tax=Sulfitobacter sp. D35 TaxID=3083252 RepID=UPI00296EA7BD|nr:hypothetical protein [Sulfitobacter sp. D35]MDW4496576.1 hypothetical protein [Sulfitobacter sp. D35]